MAVSVQHYQQNERTTWEPRDSMTYPSYSSWLVTDIMSYPYRPTQEDPEADLTHQSYLPGYPPPSTSSMERMPLAQRRETLSRFKLKKSLSTPNVRPQGNDLLSEHGSLGLSGEKKRNKLGYHRTLVACTNCRKRKIRCEASKDDVRCKPCIHLKKVCEYGPVDQKGRPPPSSSSGSRGPPPPPGPPGPPGVGVRATAGGRIVTASPHPTGTHSHPPPYHQISTVPGMQAMGAASSVRASPDDHRMPGSASNPRAFGYGQGMAEAAAGDLGSPWRNCAPDQAGAGAGGSPFSPYAPHGLPPSSSAGGAWAAATPLGTPSVVEGGGARAVGEAAWPPPPSYSTMPTRSVSYNNSSHEVVPVGGGPYAPAATATTTTRAYDNRRASMAADMYHPPINTNLEGMQPTAGLDPRSTLSAGAVSSSSYSAWQQQQQQQQQQQHQHQHQQHQQQAQHQHQYPGWYGESGGQAGGEQPGHGHGLYYGQR
ncbi:hypothetical protein GGR56DRAFT_689418 [Xylariaceae sp. FL0804]|nr:hypothetical protein GGR56DRAFT_689418 [Xylariaceae sp. FL0804]